ncbi:MAG: tRNA (N(6)-L-threonylcarbamoyladenosine(37)-C(2))-methylthiotransferase MtaB [Bacteroidales bacterium]
MTNPPRVAFYTLGCKLNFAETSTIERLFVERGFQPVDFNSSTDVVVINTCTVTASADKKCRNIINKAARISPGAFIAVVGCYSQLKADEIARIPGVDLVLGSREKFGIFEYADQFKKKEEAEIYSCAITGKGGFSPSYSVSGRTRSFLKIQDGCDYFCSYCTIPMARGGSRSATVKEIITQAREIARSGVKEVVLTGVNIGDFGTKGSESLLELLQNLEEKTDIERFRISSIEPNLLSDDIISLVAKSEKFAPHFHMPLQSGCEAILEKMNRKYRPQLFSDRVKRIKNEIPLAGIGADIITGFPGETDKNFIETYEFLKESNIAFLHVFSYSDRKNTKASGFPDKVSPQDKDSRSKILHELADEKLSVFYEKCTGTSQKVLFESFNKKGRMSGFTGNYVKVETPWNEDKINSFVSVELIGQGEDGIMKAKISG